MPCKKAFIMLANWRSPSVQKMKFKKRRDKKTLKKGHFWQGFLHFLMNFTTQIKTSI